jgi:ssDNA-binding Zn-finger/Zn-ribbon topoisomerase 1
MPFLAYLNEKPVTPVGVSDGTTVNCPDCGDPMYPRGGDNRVPIRHFTHQNEQAEDCTGSPSPGESDYHAFLKGIAVSRLDAQFPDASVNVEASIRIPEEGHTDERRADVAVDLPENNPYWGEGLIIEIQYRNHSKNLLATTQDYLRAGYSVFWARTQDFDTEDLAWDTMQAAFENNANEDKSIAYAVYNFDPEDISLRPKPHLVWEDPRPDCEHDWTTESDVHIEHQSCPGCGINRIYDRENGKFLYDTRGILGPVARDPAHRLGPCPESVDGEHDWNEREYRLGTWFCPDCRRVLVEFEEGTTILATDYPGDPHTLESNPYTCTHDWSYNHDPDREERIMRCTKCRHREMLDEDDPRWVHRH